MDYAEYILGYYYEYFIISIKNISMMTYFRDTDLPKLRLGHHYTTYLNSNVKC